MPDAHLWHSEAAPAHALVLTPMKLSAGSSSREELASPQTMGSTGAATFDPEYQCGVLHLLSVSQALHLMRQHHLHR